EPSSRPFRLAPASGLSLSSPENPRASSPCSHFTVLLPEERRDECPGVADADATSAPAPSARTMATASTTEEGRDQFDEVRDPSPPLEHWAYRIFPYLIPIGVVAGGLENSLEDSPLRSFRFTDEQYFGANTYAGGADKASHFVDYAIVTKEI